MKHQSLQILSVLVSFITNKTCSTKNKLTFHIASLNSEIGLGNISNPPLEVVKQLPTKII